jgi:hypothetical protein
MSNANVVDESGIESEMRLVLCSSGLELKTKEMMNLNANPRMVVCVCVCGVCWMDDALCTNLKDK